MSQPFKNIYEATVQSGRSAASAVYFPEDLAKIMPGKDYKDYLLERGFLLAELAEKEAVRVVEIPFDAALYRKWLARSGLADSPEARGRWALHAAGDPEIMKALEKKHPTLPMPPIGEATEALTVFIPVAVTAASPQEAKRISRRIPEASAVRIARAVEALFPDVPGYQWLSPLRSRGLKAVAGNLLVPGQTHASTARLANAMVLTEALAEPVKADVLELPGEVRIDGFDDFADLDPGEVYSLLAVLPVVLVGASWDVRYAVRAVDKRGASSAARIAVEALRRIGVSIRSPESFLPVCSEHTIGGLVQSFYELAESVTQGPGQGEEKPAPKPNLRVIAGGLLN